MRAAKASVALDQAIASSAAAALRWRSCARVSAHLQSLKSLISAGARIIMPPMLECRCTRGWCTTGLPVGCAATDAQHTLQERTGVGQRPAAESGMPRSICYLLPWPPGWCCSRQPCSCGGETTVGLDAAKPSLELSRNRKSGRLDGSQLMCPPCRRPPSDLIVRAPPKPRRQPTRYLMMMLPVVQRAREAPGGPLQRKSRGNEDTSFEREY